jgi:5-methylcytosine-specific restriction endonuclease McrA
MPADDASTFVEPVPTPESTWRSIILFGSNVASYKFALGAALLELGRKPHTTVSLEELAEPYTRHLLAHLARADRQSTSPSSRFLDACRQHATGKIGNAELLEETVITGFNNVLDAFHTVRRSGVPLKFFEDNRQAPTPGIVLTDTLLQLATGAQAPNLGEEVESRWSLVETAWSLNMASHTIDFDPETEALFVQLKGRRRNVTSCRGALDGYQKGVCFYCFAPVSVVPKDANLADVDHLIPHVLEKRGLCKNLDGVWNLVLACTDCNRGTGGKFERPTVLRYVERLHTRNEFLIGSHHPLRETLLKQTGETEAQRRAHLQEVYKVACMAIPGTWRSANEGPATF